jgi:hypothetical protein
MIIIVLVANKFSTHKLYHLYHTFCFCQGFMISLIKFLQVSSVHYSTWDEQ